MGLLRSGGLDQQPLEGDDGRQHRPVHGALARAGTLDDAEWAQAWTVDHWRDWLTLGSLPDHPWRSILERSALTLKGLIHAPTGAPIAAATTSLPETPGGSRNWDYRYTWLRDGVFTLSALGDLGFLEETSAFVRFICALVAGGEELQVMYGVGGERDLPESTLDHLTGYEGARPVRIGNGAAHQRQHDMWGVLLDLVRRDAQRQGALAPAIWTRLGGFGGRARARGHWS